jgi:hypothetical protein
MIDMSTCTFKSELNFQERHVGRLGWKRTKGRESLLRDVAKRPVQVRMSSK